VKRRLALIFGGLGVLVALTFALARVDLRGAWEYAAGHPLEVALAAAAYTAAFALRAASWRPLIGAPVPLPKLFNLLMGALFLNHAAPAKAGDLARMYALSRLVPSGRAVASVVLSRILDLVGLLAVLAAALTLAGAGGWGRLVLPALVVAGAAGVLCLLARLRLPDSLLARFGAVGRTLGRAQEALGETGRGALLRSFAFAAPAWVLEAGILHVVGRGLGLGLTPAEVVAATCFAVLVAAVPLTPGAIGTYEAGMVAILLAFGVSAEAAFAAAVITHAMKFLYAFAAAPFAFGEGLAALEKGKVRPDEARF
jgi:uncharacterized membrane protein YbhN (UPF0104 family)